MKRTPLTTLALLVLSAAANYPAYAASAEVVNIVLKEWSVLADKTTVRAGAITFRAENRGKEEHELVIFKTSHPHDALPLTQANEKVNEKAGGEVIGKIEPFPPGRGQEGTFTLSPGRYVLLCNIVEKEENGEIESHYEEGMHIDFTVK